MNYWHMQLHPNELNWGKEKEVLEKFNLIGLGDWEEQITQQQHFESKMKVGDIVAIKRGSLLIALTKVIGEYQYTEKTDSLLWFQRRRKVEILDWYNDEHNFYVSPRGTLTRCNTSNEDAESNISITSWYKIVISKMQQNTIKELLFSKHQIILQGPPGTGKTRLAKLIADDIVTQKVKQKPIDLILKFIKDFEVNEENRLRDLQIIEKFQKQFPKENIKDLKLENYCIGQGNKNSFCYWIEYPMWFLGQYSGFSNKFRIYFNKQQQDYVKVRELENLPIENAMKTVAEYIDRLVNQEHTEVGTSLFGLGFQCKVLNSYYPDKYFPIFKEEHIDNALKLMDITDFKGDYFDKNKKLVEFLNQNKGDKDIKNVELMRFLYSEFGLEYEVEETKGSKIIKKGETKLIQFHPSYSYEDFVRGIVASTSEKGIEYKTENKILASFAFKALENPASNYVLIIDEINRANLPSVLGELIYALEYRYDESMAEETTVNSMYSIDGDNRLMLPKNLYIIGTMNTADRSVGHIDYAIRRRFAFVNIPPDEEVIKNEEAKLLYNRVKNIFINNLSSDFNLNDILIGHSYFLTNDDKELKMKLDYEIKPILYEYLKDGVFLESAKEEIENL